MRLQFQYVCMQLKKDEVEMNKGWGMGAKFDAAAQQAKQAAAAEGECCETHHTL